jgi:hypothetical protein
MQGPSGELLNITIEFAGMAQFDTLIEERICISGDAMRYQTHIQAVVLFKRGIPKMCRYMSIGDCGL